MSASKYSQFQRERRRNSSSVESIPDPNKAVMVVTPVVPSPPPIIKTEPLEMAIISNNNNSNNYRPYRHATNSQNYSYSHQRSYQESLSPIYYDRTRYQRQDSVSPPPHPSGRWDRRSYSPHPYQKGCSRSPRPYQREPTPIRYRRDYSRSHSPYRRDYSRSRSPYRWAYSRSATPNQWDYTPPPPPPPPPPCRYTRSPPPMSGRYDQSSRWDRSRSPYFRRRSFSRSPSPYYRRRTYNSVSPPRGRSPTVRDQRRDDSPVYGYQQYIPSYQYDHVPSVQVDSRAPSPEYRRAEPSPQVYFAPQSPIYIPSASSSSNRSSHTNGQNIHYGYARRSPSQQQQPGHYSRSPEYRRRSLSPQRESARVTTRSDRSHSSNSRSGSSEEVYLTPENTIIDLISPSRSPSVQRLVCPLQDGAVYEDDDEEKNITDIYSYSGEYDQVLPDDSMYMTRENVNRRVNYITPLADATNSITTDSTATNSTAINSASARQQRSRLPGYWRVKMTNDGDIYYLNTITNEQSSTRPSV